MQEPLVYFSSLIPVKTKLLNLSHCLAHPGIGPDDFKYGFYLFSVAHTSSEGLQDGGCRGELKAA